MYYSKVESYLHFNYELFSIEKKYNKYFSYKEKTINNKNYKIYFIENIPILIPKYHFSE